MRGNSDYENWLLKSSPLASDPRALLEQAIASAPPGRRGAIRDAFPGIVDPVGFTCRYGSDPSAAMTERELFLAAQAGLYEPGMPVNTVNTRAAKALGIIPKDIEYRGCPRGSRRR